MKTCTKCNQTKPFDGFWNDKRTRDGKYSSCITCEKELGKRNRRLRFLRSQKNPASTRKCKICKITKPSSDYYKGNNIDGLQTYCKPCVQKQNSIYGKQNRAKLLVKERERSRKIRSFVDDLKKNPCIDCGVQYPCCAMEFDHVRGDKKFNISIAPRKKYSLDRIREEIDKCELVCANCHAVRTKNRGY